MSLLILLIVPLVASLSLAFIGDRKYAPEVNIAGSAATFVAGVALALEVYRQGPMLAGGNFFFVDAFNVYLAVLTSFVSVTTAIFSRRYMRRERKHGTLGHRRMRFYHAMYQLFIFAMLLCLLTNNVGVLWIAMELATLSTVLLVSLYRTPSAIEAAWKYFILCGVGIALALFGTVLLYFAAEKVLGEVRPVKRCPAGAEDLFSGKIEEHRPEESEGDADAAEYEIFPCRLNCSRCPV